MAVTDSARSHRPSLFAPIPAAFASVWRGLRRRAEAARIERELNALSDHELRDLGLSRGDIPTVARNATE